VSQLLFCLLLTASVGTLLGQQISGSISGVVKDNQLGVITGAKVQLVDTAQGTMRELTTGSDGAFSFTNLQPATYTLTVEQTGFKKFEQKELKIFASDRILLGDIVLQVGALTETITVEATVAQVQAQSAERSGVLTGTQVVDLALISRNFLDLARTVPGIVYTGGLGGIQSNGNRGNQNNLTVDGVTNVDTGSNGGELATMNIDMIAEFKLITNSQPAEFGRSSGAQIQVVTKSGTKDFHGTGYLFHRHEGLNANSWRNNIEGRQRNLYRYNYAGFNIGGPAYIPGVFNKNKEKFFFFMGIEWQNQLVANALRNVTVPTAAQRAGDFSQTRDGGGIPQIIRDPLTGLPFPDNKIPANRFNPDGVKILNFYPLPNVGSTDPSFNYQTQISHAFPRREQIYRGDYNINEKWRLYSRFIKTASQQNMPYGQWNADYNIPFGPMNFGNPGWSFITNVTTIVNPSLTNEFIFGSSKNVLNIDPVDDAFKRAPLNLSYKMPFPDADKLGLVQNWRYGGVPNAPTSNFAGTPFRNFNHTWDITDNVSKIWGAHTFKAGIYLHYSQKDQTAFTTVNGHIDFGRDSSNPGDTNWAFSNALLGNYRTLEQSNTVLNGQYRYWNVEWFLQDNWRLSRNLTLDFGMRFYWIQPQYDQALQTSSFNPDLYNNAARGVLLQPVRLPNGTVVARNPITGADSPAALIGAIVNTGQGFVNGLYANGMGRAGQDGYPRGLMDDRGIHYAPRIGLAWSFMPKTVLRVGGGVFYDRFQGNPVFDMLPNPPSTIRPQFFYGNLASIPSASAGVFFPANVIGFDKQGHVPTTYNWNVSIQRELPGSILFDIGYVGSRGLHNIYRLNYNAIPLGAAWLPENQDPRIANPLFDGTTTKPINLYRPRPGYADTNVIGFGGYSSYHSLQVSANRRLSRGLTFGAAYTWSRTLGLVNGDGDFVHPVSARNVNYGPLSYDIPHNFVLNLVYDVPGLARGSNFLDNPVGRLIFNGWQVSGIYNAQSGTPTNVGFGDGAGNQNERYTGSPNIGPRVVMTGNPNGKKQEYAWIDTSVFRLPTLKGSTGMEHGNNMIRNPGYWNLDASVFKNIPIAGEQRFLQLRLEMFNALNNPQFNGFNTGMTFNRSTGQIVNLPNALGGNGGRFGFGALTGTRDPRRIQLAAKFYF